MSSIDEKAPATSSAEQVSAQPAVASTPVQFPYKNDQERLLDYSYNELLFNGDHFEAFNLRVANEEYNRAYSKLRYVMVNFAGLISKICADMLFSEPLTITMPADYSDEDKAYVQKIWDNNKLDVQCYESALQNSYEGDAVFKVRIGKRHENDIEKTIIIEDITPRIYFPQIDPFNMRAQPKTQELAWKFTIDKQEYLRKEIHEPGKITNKVFLMKGTEVLGEVGLDVLGIDGLQPEVSTLIDESLVIHIPNWRVGSKWNGRSDYFDLDALFFAINNRITKNDNILDKHSDPILMVPKGVIGEDGKVNKKALGVIEMGEGEDGKPEYIVWDASLENAFKEIEKLVEFIYMIGEVSPDVLGLGTGVSDSGRALKFKLMRTIAKVARKKLYYYVGLRQVLLVAQKLAKAYHVTIDGKEFAGQPVMPELQFADGLPIDDSESIDMESQAIDIGITSKKSSMKRVYGLTDKEADAQLKEIEDEKPKIVVPPTSLNPNAKPGNPANPFTPKPAPVAPKAG